MADQTQTGERTEKPTAKKLKDARERGQVARSRDLSAALSLAGATLGIGWLGVSIATAISERLAVGLSTLAGHARGTIEPGAIAALLWNDAGLYARLAGPPAIIAGVASVAASVAQIGWSYSPKALQPNWSRLSPSQALQRLTPAVSLSELGKALIGLVTLGVLSYLFVRDIFGQAPVLMAMTPAESAAFGWNRLWTLLWRSAIALAILAALDFLVQYWRWFSQLKMTRQEVRDEAKTQDANPEIKARVRRIQRDMSRKRMLHAVKTATVVVTNPTHFAVALEYRRAEMAAPRVVAKGQDELALRIRKLAREHGVPIVENVALARALHKTADVGDTVPTSLFGAVAEVLAYLVRLKQLSL